MSSFFGPMISGKRAFSAAIVDRQCRLRDVGELRGIAHGEAGDIRHRLDQMHSAFTLAHRALDFRMAGVADHHDLAAVLAHLRDLDVHLRHQRARRVEDGKAAARRLAAHGFRDAMCAEDDGRTVRNLVQRLDEHRSLALQVVDDVAVVDDLVANVDGGAKLRERELDDCDRPVDAGAEAARIGKQNVHQRDSPSLRTSLRRSRKLSMISAAAPSVIALSATLNAG